MNDPLNPLNNSSAQPTHVAQPAQWERKVLEDLAFAALKEQRVARRWKIFFRLLAFLYVGLVLALILGWHPFSSSGAEKHPAARHTALISIEGVIQAGGPASAEKIIPALQAAFEDTATQGVILRINSPGGSPVQAGMINDEIYRLREIAKKEKRNIKVHVVVEEMCASGGYYIAAAADNIYVNKASIVGSIGVLMDGFGATGLMEKLGVERRLLTAGENKAMLDPFSPVKPEHQAYIKGMLDEIHQQFIAVVKKGRGQRLKDSPDMFSGLFWSGAKSIELGLTDAFGTVETVARDVIKAEDIVDYTEKENLAERFAKRFGAAAAKGAAKTADEALNISNQKTFSWR